MEDDGTFKKFSHKDITQDLYYNVICDDAIEMIQKVPKKEYMLPLLQIYHMDFEWRVPPTTMNLLGPNN